jgi:hypothetical protein
MFLPLVFPFFSSRPQGQSPQTREYDTTSGESECYIFVTFAFTTGAPQGECPHKMAEGMFPRNGGGVPTKGLKCGECPRRTRRMNRLEWSVPAKCRMECPRKMPNGVSPQNAEWSVPAKCRREYPRKMPIGAWPAPAKVSRDSPRTSASFCAGTVPEFLRGSVPEFLRGSVPEFFKSAIDAVCECWRVRRPLTHRMTDTT